MKKNEIIGLGIYAGIIAVLCLIFTDWQIPIAVLGIMGFAGYERTRQLRRIGESIQKDKENDHESKE